MTITGGQFITGIKNASKETGIPGTGEEEDIFGYAMATIATGITGMKKEHGGILPGIILPGPFDHLLINFYLIISSWKKSRNKIIMALFLFHKNLRYFFE
jgi:hypothetical protein